MGGTPEPPTQIMSHVEDIAGWICDQPKDQRAEAPELVETEIDDQIYVERVNRGGAE